MSFAADLTKFKEKTLEKASKVTEEVVFEIAKSLVDRSPVGDPSYWKKKPPAGYTGGQFKANWNYGFNLPDFSTAQIIDKVGTITLEKIQAKISKEAGVHYITNGLEYANRLETGWSRQAPNGMVGLTVIEFKQIVGNAVRKYQ